MCASLHKLYLYVIPRQSTCVSPRGDLESIQFKMASDHQRTLQLKSSPHITSMIYQEIPCEIKY